LASRARRHIEGDDAIGRFAVESADEQRLVEQFIDACANGDVDGLVAVLDPDVAGVAELSRRVKVRRTGRSRVVRSLLRVYGPGSGCTLLSFPVNGSPGVLVFRGGRPAATVELMSRNSRVHHLHAVVDWRSLGGWRAALGARRRG
jgi:RNA polymerase sigma-70 factor (ECF subfamily)